MNTYTKIGDANQESAFLTNEGGYDVAVLSRVLRESVPSDHQSLPDDQRQQLINLIDAAPDLLAVLREVRDIGVLSCCCERHNGKCCGTCTATKIDAAIAKAGGAL